MCKQSPRISVSIRAIGFLSALLVASPCPALADSQRLVIPGQEIVVSFAGNSGPIAGMSAPTVSALRVPEEMTLRARLGDSSIGVLSTSDALGIRDNEPVPVDDEQIASACAALREQNARLKFTCEANVLFRIQKEPNDPMYSSLYGMQRIKAPAAWDITTGNAIKVAVVDTGVQYSHPDLSANIAENSNEVPDNGLDDDNNGYVDDYFGYNFVSDSGDPGDDNGHGTHCAGTIGARGDDGVGVVGVNWVVEIIPVKVLDGEGSGTLAAIASGINYAVARGARIVSLSLGGPSSSSTLAQAISNGQANNVLFVVAAGNETNNNDTNPSFPASLTNDSILAIAATDENDNLASFSNFGVSSVDVAAPGVNIVSTVPTSSYDSYSGTSMATPMTAGVAALILSANPALSYADVKTIIMNTVEVQSSLVGVIATGGRVNAAAAVQAAQGSTPTQPVPDPQPTAAPDPGAPVEEDPGEEDPGFEDEHEIELDARRSGRNKILVYGYVYDSFGDEVASERVRIVCEGRKLTRHSVRTRSNGYFSKKINRPRGQMYCYAETEYGESDEITLP